MRFREAGAETVGRDQQHLTADEIALLKDLARDILAGRRVIKFLAWLGAVVLWLAALVYHLQAIRHGMHDPKLGGGS